MSAFLFDTDILSYFLKGNQAVTAFVSANTSLDRPLSFSLISYYEILSGLLHRDASRRLASFEAFAGSCRILPLTQSSVSYSARLYAELRQAGTPVDDIDLLIAGVALDHEITLLTNNLRHFGRIQALSLQSIPLQASPG